jgi:hypothetical protein
MISIGGFVRKNSLNPFLLAVFLREPQVKIMYFLRKAPVKICFRWQFLSRIARFFFIGVFLIETTCKKLCSTTNLELSCTSDFMLYACVTRYDVMENLEKISDPK